MSDDLILAFDTSAAHCAAALLWGRRDGDRSEIERIVTQAEAMNKGQAERLVPMLEEMLAAQGLVWKGISRLVVGVGPGNFTGIRISVSLARGLALALNIPAIGVTGFDAVAMASGNPPFPYWVLIDAPRGQVYAQRFPSAAPTVIEAEDVAGLDAPVMRRSDLDMPAFVAALAETGFRKPVSGAPRPAPLYIRGADAAPSSDLPPVMLP